MPAENTTPLIPAAPLDVHIEALLFASGSSMKKSTLAKHLGVSTDELDVALQTLAVRLTGGATRLLEVEGGVMLATAPSVAELVTNLHTKEFAEDIGDAGLEVLAIVLYRGKTSRASIDYIRGVNSAATIRSLTMRGLLERSSGAEVSFQATPALLSHLGVLHVSDLPNYAEVRKELEEFEGSAQKQSTEEAAHTE